MEIIFDVYSQAFPTEDCQGEGFSSMPCVQTIHFYLAADERAREDKSSSRRVQDWVRGSLGEVGLCLFFSSPD